MKRYYFILPTFLIVLLLVTGCSKKYEQNNNEQKNQNQEQQTQENQIPRWNENFDEVSLDNLEIGQQVLVVGTENGDGSISANQIVIGDKKIDFGEMDRNFPFREREEINPDGMKNNTDRQLPAGFEGQRGGFEKMQNMNDEERAKMREQMTVRRGTVGHNRLDNMGSIARLVGEIINKDEIGITLKLEDIGSRLVFYSDETRVLKFKIAKEGQ